MKRALYAFLVSCMLALTAIGFAACGGTQIKQVTLVDWEDKTIEVDLYSDVTVDNSAVYDTEGNAYATKAEVTKKSGEAVLALDGTFRADYAGGYSIVYTLADESVSASAKTVTVKIKGTDTPAPYFKTSRLSVMENTAFSVPDRGYVLDPAFSVSSETLTLYRVDGEERTKVEADLTAQVTLPAGTYVFVYEVKAGDKTGSAELAFRVKIKSEQFALAALNGEGENALGVSCWDNGIGGWTLGSVSYTSEVARNEYVSNGSAKMELPASNGAAHVYVIPEISQADFVAKMNKPGALVSIWLYSDAENGEPRSVTCGTKGVSLPDKTWTNVKVSAEEFGFKDDPAGFWTALSMGKSALFSVNNAGSAYTLYVDSIYVAEPLTGTFESATCAYGSEVTLAAHSEQTDKFYYELLDTVDGTAAQMSADGKFTPRVAGKILAKAYPCDNGYYAEAMTTVVTVTHTASLTFDKDSYEFDYGMSDRPTATVTGGEAQVQYRLDSADGSQSFSYLADDGKIRLFEGTYTLTATAKIGDVDYVTFATITADAAPVQKGIIENYDSPESVQNTRWALATYMGDFKGEQGVIRYDLAGDMWPGYQMNYSLQTKEALLEQGFDENDYLAIHFYMENVPSNYIILDFVKDNGQYNLRYINEGWNTAYLSAGRFLNSFDQWFSPEYSGYFFFTNNNYTGPLYVYIDWIGLVKNEHGTDVVVEEGGVEFDNFDHEHATIGVAANSTDLLVSWVSEYEGREGVMKLYTEAPYNARPTFRGPVSRLTKEQFIAKGVDASFDVFCVDVYVASDGNYVMLDGSGNTLARFDEGKKWYTVEVPVSYVLDHLDNFSFAFSDEGKAHPHEVYIDRMYFKSGLGAAIEGNKLVRRADNPEYIYKFTVNGSSDDSYVIDVKTGYNLLPLASDAKFSTGYTIVVTRYNSQGTAVGESATLTWSSPAGANEINGFDSTAAQQAFIGNKSLNPTFEKSVSDGTTTKNGVVKIQFNEYPWPDIKIGAPMLTKEQSAQYVGENNYVVISAYFTANNMSGLKLTYRHFTETNADYTVDIQTGWNNYFIPVIYFDYDQIAAGRDFFFVARNDGPLNDVVMYLDAIYFEYREPVTEFHIEDNKLTVENPNSGVTYKFTVNGSSDDSYVIDTENGFDLTTLVTQQGVFSADYTIVVQGYNATNEAVGESETLTWSSPAGANEINGFDSTAAQQAFIGNKSLNPTFEKSVSDGTTTKNGVVKIQFNEYPWPDIKIGAPMLTKEQSAQYVGENNYVVISAYFTANNMSGLKLTYRHFTETNAADYTVDIRTGWNNYSIPVSYFDYDQIAAGRDYFFVARNNEALTDVVMYLDAIYFEYRDYLLTDTKAVFFDFNDPNNLSRFGTAGGNNRCTYVESETVTSVSNSSDSTTLTNCIRYQETGMWPEIKGIQSAMSKSVYESFVSAGDKFVIEGYCNTNAGGNTLYYNVGGGDVAIGSLPKGGTFRFEIDAQIILDHFDDFVNGTNNVKIMFNNGGYEVTHDIYFTGMYFEKV